MGNWGYEPKDGDGALDRFYVDVELPARKALIKAYQRHPYARGHLGDCWNRLGMLQKYLELGHSVPRSVLKVALRDVSDLETKRFKSNQGLVWWCDNWSDPKKARRSLEVIRSVLDGLLSHCGKGNRRPNAASLRDVGRGEKLYTSVEESEIKRPMLVRKKARVRGRKMKDSAK